MIESLLQSSPSWMNFFVFFGLATCFLFVVLGFVTYGILAEGGMDPTKLVVGGDCYKQWRMY
jgi:hypothetical protein